MSKPQTYKKRPLPVEALQLTWENWNDICDFVPKPWFVMGTYVDEKGEPTTDCNGRIGLQMKTLESNLFLAVEGDYIIKGIKGEFYACKPDIFEQTYELDGQIQ